MLERLDLTPETEAMWAQLTLTLTPTLPLALTPTLPLTLALTLTPTLTLTLTRWAQLSELALQIDDLPTAERCYGAVGNVSKCRYLRKVNTMVEP